MTTLPRVPSVGAARGAIGGRPYCRGTSLTRGEAQRDDVILSMQYGRVQGIQSLRQPLVRPSKKNYNGIMG